MRKIVLLLLLSLPLLASAVDYHSTASPAVGYSAPAYQTATGSSSFSSRVLPVGQASVSAGLPSVQTASAYSSPIQAAGQLTAPGAISSTPQRRASYRASGYTPYRPQTSVGYGASPLYSSGSSARGVAGRSGGMMGGTTSFTHTGAHSTAAAAYVSTPSIPAVGTILLADDDDDLPPTSNQGHKGDEPIIVPMGDMPLLLLLLLCLAFAAIRAYRLQKKQHQSLAG